MSEQIASARFGCSPCLHTLERVSFFIDEETGHETFGLNSHATTFLLSEERTNVLTS